MRFLLFFAYFTSLAAKPNLLLITVDDPVGAEVPAVQVEEKNGAIQPMKDDWLPPGVTRQ
jgi:hypothetical protein|tara:strand:- start:1277 stop:1456 length:180 start_codon:yes stop_codon:yes gene_type:complete